MKVVVTGGNGLVGRYVVSELANPSPRGTAHSVTVFDLIDNRNLHGVSQIVGDHGNIEDLLRAFDGAEAVLHLSALQPTVPPSEETFRANVQGTMNVFDAALRCGVKKVVNWSSVWALGWSQPGNAFTPDYLPIDEDHPLRANDPYGRAKIESEVIAESFHGQEGLEAVTLRPVFTALPETLALLWRSNGVKNPTYSHLAYVDVRDQAMAARRALEIRNDSYITAYLAADDSRVMEPLCDLLPRLFPPIGDLAQQLTESQSSISNHRARDVLGWSPSRSWRNLTVAQRMKGYAVVSLRRATRKVVPGGA